MRIYMLKMFYTGVRDKKKYRVICISKSILLSAVLFLGPFISSVAAQEGDVIFGSSDTPPFWSETMPDDGFCGEIFHAISREINVKSVIEYHAVQRLIEITAKTPFNIAGNPALFAPKQEYVAIVPIAMFRVAFFYYSTTPEKKITYKSLTDLKEYTIGVRKGIITDRTHFDNAGIKFEESYSNESLYKKLKLGRLDLCLDIELAGLMATKKLFPGDLEHFRRIELPESVTPIAIMFHRDYPHGKELGSRYLNGLMTIIENGKYHQILEKYFGEGNIPEHWFSQLGKYINRYAEESTAPLMTLPSSQ